MIWIVIYAGLALATLGLIAITCWRVFGAAKNLGLAVHRSQQRVGELLPPLQAAMADLEARHSATGRFGAGSAAGRAGSGGAGYAASRAEQVAHWDSISPAPWTTDGRQGGRHRADPRGRRRAEHRTDYRADQRG